MKKIVSLLCAGLMMLPAFSVDARADDRYSTELQEILDNILTEDMTGEEKVEAIIKYVGETYHYDAYGQTFDYVLENGGGDCWATTDMIVHLADLAGLRAVYHDASCDSGPVIYSTQHICAQILADGNIYLADAGFSDNSPVQYYIISLGDEPYRILDNEDGTVTARTYAGFDATVVVPETLGGKTVTKIGEWAFQQWQLHGLNAAYLAYLKWEFIKPETVSLPDTITEIGKGAFYQNDLSKIYLPSSLRSVGESAFYDCANLTDIYYSGTEEQWRAVEIESGNESLENAVIHYQATEISEIITGDVNADGEFTIADVILLQKWLLNVPDTHLANQKAGDLYADDILDAFDICLMKKALLNQG